MFAHVQKPLFREEEVSLLSKKICLIFEYVNFILRNAYVCFSRDSALFYLKMHGKYIFKN